jgi:uncharacterized membrane-anchored protein YitT (DUF2179 family)
MIVMLFGSTIMALNINSFVHFGNIVPGGFTGITILVQRLFSTFFDIIIPFSIIYLPLNLIPAAICFKFIGKRFAIYSVISIFLTSIIVDFVPYISITAEPLLSSIFGGIVNGFAVSLCLLAGASTGGTDFISLLMSKKYGKDTFNYILLGNAIILIIAGAIYSWDSVMYSIIYQYVSTQILHTLYRRYQKLTLFIVTDKPEKVYEQIRECTNHGATLFKGLGFYQKKERSMVYSVVSSDELYLVMRKINEVDKDAFIDVIRTEKVIGRFNDRPYQ